MENTGHKDQALADFEGFHPIIQNVLQNAEIINRWALYDRKPFETWHDGKAVLLGDACHPMLPSMAQGAVQAIEDAWVLADCLNEEADFDQAFDKYYTQRVKRVSRIQKISVQNVRLFHKSNLLTQFMTYAPAWLLGKINPNILHKRHDWIYGHDVTESKLD